MKILVTYKSKTGNTRRYAEKISEQLQADLMEFSQVTAGKMGTYDAVLYGGGIYAGTLNGMKKIRELFKKSGVETLILFATGGSPNVMKENIETCWKNILPGEDFDRFPHFYMQAGINYQNMGKLDKTLMHMMVSHLNRKKNKTEEEAEAANMMAGSYDLVDFQYAEPLIHFVQSLSAKKQR